MKRSKIRAPLPRRSRLQINTSLLGSPTYTKFCGFEHSHSASNKKTSGRRKEADVKRQTLELSPQGLGLQLLGLHKLKPLCLGVLRVRRFMGLHPATSLRDWLSSYMVFIALRLHLEHRLGNGIRCHLSQLSLSLVHGFTRRIPSLDL